MPNKSSSPIQYKRGYCEFYKLSFKLTPDVLIPRPETELLVDEALRHSPLSIIDVGTGSGCIAISIAKRLANTKVWAVDKSDKALEVAIDNARIHKVEDQVIFMQSDLLSVFGRPGLRSNIDIIIANLPYIPTSRLMHIDPMVRDFEPRIALDGGIDGFELYRKLFAQVVEYRLYPKILIIEIDEQQAEIALSEAKKYFPKAQSEIKKDLTEKDRILKISFAAAGGAAN